MVLYSRVTRLIIFKYIIRSRSSNAKPVTGSTKPVADSTKPVAGSTKPVTATKPDIIIEEKNNAGIITLNRPQALNALNLSMVEKLLPLLYLWAKEKKLVIMKGAGGRAFCAGADVKSIIQAGLKGERYGHDFFRKEYVINGYIARYDRPYITLVDGITMGGGVGLAVNGKYFVTTERTLFAMPETAIGLFPDVGSSYFLSRLEGKLGLYLGMTGARLKGFDVHKAGLATHCVESSKLAELEASLLECKSDKSISETLQKFSTTDTTEFSLKPHLAKINNCFGAANVEDIFTNLETDGTEWALETLKLLRQMSPTSLKITFQQLLTGRNLDLKECLKMEYRIAVRCLDKKQDFFEGVRAVLIDKDKSPKWCPATVEEVEECEIKNYFRSLPHDLELTHKVTIAKEI